jgi:cytochrome P450
MNMPDEERLQPGGNAAAAPGRYQRANELTGGRPMDFFPPPRTCPFDPPPALAAYPPAVRVKIWDGSTPWLLTRHEHVRAVLADRRFSADASRPGYPRRGPASGARRHGAGSFLTMDPPEHTRYRRMLIGEFGPRRAEKLAPSVRAIADRLIDGMKPGDDLVPTFALPLPSSVISDLLGVPYADHEFFERCAATMVDNSADPDVIGAATAELAGYLGRLIVAKQRHPTDDLLGRLVRDHVVAGDLSLREAVAIAILLLIAGHETTANMIALSVAFLLHNDLVDAFRAGTAGVDELLRLLTIAHTGRRRVAAEDVALAGVTIRAGEGVIAAADAANRDPAAFDEPDRPDFDRSPNHHVAFGFGAHLCTGHHLARLEVKIALNTLFERMPGLRLATPTENLPFRHTAPIYGVDALPLSW